ncbi:uncharacterized protein J4E92_000540 [Alternaria infectoria]|uniref:uncharacterized protein n=1 Tax=Alternaria infectoria TaxID=45303 RepID=UPI00221E73E8|nr:uncharacterized protein J4E92_000540 [Alternaria infectoria]KAI4939256.1 hypothetical protein J4E92_000540 [Alternaria infectoria]
MDSARPVWPMVKLPEPLWKGLTGRGSGSALVVRWNDRGGYTHWLQKYEGTLKRLVEHQNRFSTAAKYVRDAIGKLTNLKSIKINPRPIGAYYEERFAKPILRSRGTMSLYRAVGAHAIEVTTDLAPSGSKTLLEFSLDGLLFMEYYAEVIMLENLSRILSTVDLDKLTVDLTITAANLPSNGRIYDPGHQSWRAIASRIRSLTFDCAMSDIDVDSLEELYGTNTATVSHVVETPMEEVRRFFLGKSHTQILQYGLGMEIPGAPPLAAHTIVVTMDCEMHEIEPRVLTEYGLNTFSRKEMAPVLNSPGIHGEKILRNIYYYHIRVRENAHLINWRFVKGNPERNHFGSTRFATKEDAKEFLVETLAWPIDDDNEDGPKCPVIFLGHSVKNDLRMLQEELGIDPKFDSNVVAIIDTQKIANEQGIRGKGQKKGQQIALKTLIIALVISLGPKGLIEFSSNDAAYTIISAVQMVLKNSLPTDPTRSLQDVVDGVSEDMYSIDTSLHLEDHRIDMSPSPPTARSFNL